MPEMTFRVRWPDGSETSCYSPSLVVHDHLVTGAEYPLAEFVDRSTTALRLAPGGRLAVEVDVAANEPTDVSDANEEADADGSLLRIWAVCDIPCIDAREDRIHATIDSSVFRSFGIYQGPTYPAQARQTAK